MRTDTVWIKRVANRVKVNWKQKDEAGSYCPNKIAGCVPLGVAMMMSGFRYPSKIQLFYSKGKTISLDWEKMCNHRKFGASVDVCDDQTHTTIAHLCRELGYRMNSDYRGTEGTFTKFFNITQIMAGLGFNDVSWIDEVKPLSISNALNGNTILLVKGVTTGDDPNSHLWVCDAVRHYKFCYTHYHSYDSGATWQVAYKDYSKDIAYYFYNWGWGGDFNGYFLDMNFSPGGTDHGYSSKVEFLAVTH